MDTIRTHIFRLRLQYDIMELIVAMTDNFVIGKDGDMPWHLPADLDYFKKLTSGNTVVMGRRTWESIGRALPNRKNIVITRQNEYIAKGITIAHSFNDIQKIETVGIVFIIGGSMLYKMALDVVDILHITRIHANLDGDTFFPTFDTSIWSCNRSVEYQANESNLFDMTFETWSRIT